jgi:Tfp pilus assembly protein PilF
MKSTGLAALAALAMAVPANAASYDNLNAGIQLYNMGQWKSAVEQFDKALAADELAPPALHCLFRPRAIPHSSFAIWSGD